jgi:murein L,D-transpeptidase YafK
MTNFPLLPAILLLPILVGMTACHSRAQVPEAILRQRPGLEDEVAALCQKAGVAYPPQGLFLRAFKREAELEVWGKGEGARYALIRTYPVLSSSGGPGPKRREGDRQVPEGFYRLQYLNPASLYHLSMKLDYPNASDRVRSDREQPGSDIFIHGGNGSIGCLPIGDSGIEEVFLLATKVSGAGQPIPIHVFPARMAGPDWETYRAKETAVKPELEVFWKELQTGYDAFESTDRPPEVAVEPDGRYRVK